MKNFKFLYSYIIGQTQSNFSIHMYNLCSKNGGNWMLIRWWKKREKWSNTVVREGKENVLNISTCLPPLDCVICTIVPYCSTVLNLFLLHAMYHFSVDLFFSLDFVIMYHNFIDCFFVCLTMSINLKNNTIG